MVIAGIVIDKKNEKKLVKLGVKDSKQLTPKKREELAPKIENLCNSVIVLRIPACKIDSYRKNKINLDSLEAMKMAEIINVSQAEKIFVDSLNFNSDKFKNRIIHHLEDKDIELVCENYSDETYPVVSAASIIAKVERDKVINEIKRKVNYDFGVGYSHDQRTVEFVRMLAKNNKKFPPYIRSTWVTAQIIREHSWQRKLKEFLLRKKDVPCE